MSRPAWKPGSLQDEGGRHFPQRRNRGGGERQQPYISGSYSDGEADERTHLLPRHGSQSSRHGASTHSLTTINVEERFNSPLRPAAQSSYQSSASMNSSYMTTPRGGEQTAHSSNASTSAMAGSIGNGSLRTIPYPDMSSSAMPLPAQDTAAMLPPTRLTRGVSLSGHGLVESSFQTVSQGTYQRGNQDYYIGRGGARVRIQAQEANSFHRLLSKFESLDYDVPENEPYLQREQDLSHLRRTKVYLLRWVVMCLVGLITALIAISIDVCIDHLSSVKFKYVLQSLDHCVRNDCLHHTLLVDLGFNLAFVSIATCLVVYFEPVAAGSGIPEIKCFLNGVKIPHVVRFRTLFCKAVGIVFSVAGGMPVGKEGPMIHSGAVVAAGISQGRSEFVKMDFSLFQQFRLDHEKRDFVSGGAAAGVAAAFGAPVGGVLFSLEEGASFWNQSLTWRMFFASMTAVFTLNIILSAYHGHVGDLSYNGLLDFGTFAGKPYFGYELVIFLVMGAIGGLVGALFNKINYRLSVYRRTYVDKRWKRFLEPLVVAAVVTTALFVAVLYTDECHYNGQYQTEDKKPQVFCSDGQFHSMATMVFSVPEKAVKTLFHAPPAVISASTVFIFAGIFFILACWTYGLGIPSGLFVPCILLGAAWGRGVGIGLNALAPKFFVEPGKYALIGAAATLGGVVRMTISLTVIIVESTGDITYGLPIMLTVMMAKWIGDLFNEGLYDIHIELQGVPLLPWEPPPECISLTAGDVMTKPVHCVRTVEKVGEIARLLERTSHNGFPVIDNLIINVPDGEFPSYGHFQGLILRSQLIILLKNGMFCDADGNNLHGRQHLSLEDFEALYPRIPAIQTVHLSHQIRDTQYIDLRPYLNPMPYTVTEKNTMHHVFKPFRALGLRHIVVVDEHFRVVGIVTRKDLSRYREVHGLHSDGRIMRLEVL
eukprot:scpid24505/ scgid3987/ H(+)/Cl(-) exchange transporter 7; Chloride channel protein 7